MSNVPFLLFAILQKYDFSSKSQRIFAVELKNNGCLRYCKSTIFQANHNRRAKSRLNFRLFAILQKYDFSSKSQRVLFQWIVLHCCLRYCKSTIFQANHNGWASRPLTSQLFAILQKYDFSSKSQQDTYYKPFAGCCLRYCKSTIFQANHNCENNINLTQSVVCDTAKVRFFKQITTGICHLLLKYLLFAILQKYDFSSKSQHKSGRSINLSSCLRYCKSTIFQANHN